jgi:hypothetical protein
MLAESGPADALSVLNSPERSLGFHYAPGQCERLQLFTRLGRDTLTEVAHHRCYTLRRLVIPEHTELLLAVAHLRSPLHANLGTRNEAAKNFARAVSSLEETVGHRRTLVTGDFNLDPFEEGIAGASGFHGVMTAVLAQANNQGRLHDGEFCRFFYNPMWALMGAGERTVPGSYFYWSTEQLAYFWHTYDQVLLRPELIPHWEGAGLRLLTEDGVLQFLQENGRPDTKRVSDHLPLLFRLNFTPIERNENV